MNAQQIWEAGWAVIVTLAFWTSSRSWIVALIVAGLFLYGWWEREHRGPHDLD